MACTLKAKDNDIIHYIDEFAHSTEPINRTMNNMSNNNEKPQSCGLELTLRSGEASAPLLEMDNTNNPKPMYGPEIDDLDPDGKPVDDGSGNKGIDDGLLPEERKRPSTPFPQPEYFPPVVPNVPRIPSVFPVYPDISSTPDINIYQQKKIIAQGMMDLALISANASQFRYVLQTKGKHPYYYASLAMIGVSLLVQIIVGIGLIWNCRFNVNVNSQMCKADRTNNWIVIGVFLVTILNVFISSFTVVELSETIYANCDSAIIPSLSN